MNVTLRLTYGKFSARITNVNSTLRQNVFHRSPSQTSGDSFKAGQAHFQPEAIKADVARNA